MQIERQRKYRTFLVVFVYLIAAIWQCAFCQGAMANLAVLRRYLRSKDQNGAIAARDEASVGLDKGSVSG